MEGGLLHWRVQKVDLKNFPTTEDYLKSLPNPPQGFHWERLDDYSWVLIREPLLNLQNDSDSPIITEPVVINHLVLSNDTIQGICLKYRTSVTELRRINLFSGNNIQSYKILKIPIEAGVPFTSQLQTQEYILQKFKNETNEDTTEAKLYLEGCNWDFEQAILAWKEDDVFIKHRHQDNDAVIHSAVIENTETNDTSTLSEQVSSPTSVTVTSTPISSKVKKFNESILSLFKTVNRETISPAHILKNQTKVSESSPLLG